MRHTVRTTISVTSRIDPIKKLKDQKSISIGTFGVNSFVFFFILLLSLASSAGIQAQVDPNYKPNYQIKDNEKITWLNKTPGKLSYVTGIKGTKNIIIVTSDGTASQSHDNGNSWQSGNLPDFSNPIIKTFTLDTNEIYVAYHSGDLIRSALRGTSKVTLKRSGPYPGKDVFFINKNTGFIIGEMSLQRTINGGASWNYFPYKDGDKLMGLPALASGNNFHPDTIQACSASGRIIYLEAKLHGIAFANEKNGFVVGETIEAWGRTGKPVFLSTKDGGNHWEKQNFNFTNKALHAISFVNQKVGFISGYDGLLMKTVDGGTTWDTLSVQKKTPFPFNRITFLNETVGYVSATAGHGPSGSEGVSFVIYTEDQGKTWESLDPKSNEWQSVFNEFKNEILKELGSSSTNWETLFSENNKRLNSGIPNFKENNIEKQIALQQRTNGWRSLYFENEKTIWAIDDWFGHLYRSTDRGSSWKKINTSNYITDADLNSVYFLNAKEGLIVGNKSTLLRTENGGKSWKKIPVSVKEEDISNLFFVNGQTGFAMSKKNLYKTMNGGTSWTALPFNLPVKIPYDTLNFIRTEITVSDIYFENEKKGFVYLTYSESSKFDCPPGRNGDRPCDPVGPTERHLAAITIDGGGSWHLFKGIRDGNDDSEYSTPDGITYRYSLRFTKSNNKVAVWTDLWDPEIKKAEIKFLKYADHYWGYSIQHIPTENFNCQFILDSTTRYIVGKQGRILKLENKK